MELNLNSPSHAKEVVMETRTWVNVNDLSDHFNLSEDEVIELGVKTLAYMAVKLSEGNPLFVQIEPGVVVPLELPLKKRELDEQ